MSSRPVIESKGLVLTPGELSRSGGALTVADNVNVEAPGVIRSRNGFAKQSYALGGPIWKMLATKEMGANLFANFGTEAAAASLSYGNGSAAWTALSGTYSNSPTNRMQCAVGRNNHYLTTSEGVRRVESGMTPWMAGLPKGLGLDLSGPTAVLGRTLQYTAQTGVFTAGQTLTAGAATGKIFSAYPNSGSGAGSLVITGETGTIAAGAITDPITGAATGSGALSVGFLADTESVAYRQTWCKRDAEGVIMEGAPSPAIVVYNNTRTTGWKTAVSQDVVARILIPAEVLTLATALTTAYFYRLYRSSAATSGVPPNDDMRLVAEGYLTSGNISAGYVEIYDATVEAFREKSDGLYTNATEATGGQEGLPGPDGSLYGVANSNNPPPLAFCVAQFAGSMFYGNCVAPSALDLTLLSTVAGTGLTAGDTLSIAGVTYTAHASVTSADQFVVYTVAGGSGASEAIERTAIALAECINKSTQTAAGSNKVWAYYVPDANGFPGKIRIEARTNSGTPTITITAHSRAYRPDFSTGVSGVSGQYPNGFMFSKSNQPDAVPGVNLVKEVGRGGSTILALKVLGDSLFVFTDAGLYRINGRSYGNFAVQEFDLTFKLRGRELVVEADGFLWAWGVQGIAKISSAGVEYVGNAIEPLVQQTLLNAGESWFGVYAFATTWQFRHKVLFFVPSSGSAVNCTTALVYDTRMGAWTTWSFPIAAVADAARTTGHTTAVARVSDDILYCGQWHTTAIDSHVYKERRAYTAADYADDSYNTSSVAITKALRWSAVVGSPEVATHWDELHVLYDVSPTFSGWTTPTALVAWFVADLASSSSNVSLAPTATSRMSRCLVPQAQRRSARLVVNVQHAVVSEYFGIEGLVLVYLQGDGTATVRT